MVDDEPAVLKPLRQYLLGGGHHSDMAFDGKSALRLLRKENYDLVFLDFEMPEITGLELIKIIKKDGMKTKTIMMTGYDLMENFIADSVGADEYLAKPFKLKAIDRMIEKYGRPENLKVASETKMKTILVVEDDPAISELLKERLQTRGYEILLAKDGREGFAILKAIIPDLIILDLFLPAFSGEEICKYIREQEDENVSRIPIIMLSAKKSDADRIVGKVIGANAYLTKPFDAGVLMNEVHRFL